MADGLELWRKNALLRLAQSAAPEAIKEVKDETDHEPDEKANPCDKWLFIHQKAAGNDGKNWNQRHPRRSKSSGPIRIRAPKDDDANCYKYECEESTDITKFNDFIYV